MGQNKDKDLNVEKFTFNAKACRIGREKSVNIGGKKINKRGRRKTQNKNSRFHSFFQVNRPSLRRKGQSIQFPHFYSQSRSKIPPNQWVTTILVITKSIGTHLTFLFHRNSKQVWSILNVYKNRTVPKIIPKSEPDWDQELVRYFFLFIEKTNSRKISKDSLRLH
jgi:hypothetical protein